MTKPIEVKVNVQRYPSVCPGCPAARKAGQDVARENPAIRAVAVNDCRVFDLSTGVEASMAGFELTAGGDLFNRVEGTTRIKECPGRVQEIEATINRAMGLPHDAGREEVIGSDPS